MNASKKPWWQHYVPEYAKNPFRLAWQLFTEKKPAARSAMYMAAAGAALTPLDSLFSRKERQIYAQAPEPIRPIILVCGPPRSGTTLVAQYLINNLDVCYLNNLTSLFPRSPVYANTVFGRWAKSNTGDYEAFYGKSRGLSGTNDALYIWDRWLGSNREKVPGKLVAGSGQSMRAFFGAVERLYNLPIVSKVNKLNTCANLVAECLPNAKFICVRRNPLFLAQSLYIARAKIMGDVSLAYGVQHQPSSADPIEDVCLQVLFHEQKAKRQTELLGDRFAIVSYEQFCEEPSELLEFCVENQTELQYRRDVRPGTEKFTISRQLRVPEEVFEGLRDGLQSKGIIVPNDPAG